VLEAIDGEDLPCVYFWTVYIISFCWYISRLNSDICDPFFFMLEPTR